MFWIKGLTLQSSQAVNNAKRLGWPLKELEGGVYETQAPGGYPFYLVDKEHPSTGKSHCSVTNTPNMHNQFRNANRPYLICN